MSRKLPEPPDDAPKASFSDRSRIYGEQEKPGLTESGEPVEGEDLTQAAADAAKRNPVTGRFLPGVSGNPGGTPRRRARKVLDVEIDDFLWKNPILRETLVRAAVIHAIEKGGNDMKNLLDRVAGPVGQKIQHEISEPLAVAIDRERFLESVTKRAAEKQEESDAES